MRLWHYKLLPVLPRQQLLGQHRECCTLRGNGWDRKHSTVQYALDLCYEYLVFYHWQVIDEMEKRGYNIDSNWKYGRYRGKSCGKCCSFNNCYDYREFRYEAHDDKYLIECIENLRSKGVFIDEGGLRNGTDK